MYSLFISTRKQKKINQGLFSPTVSCFIMLIKNEQLKIFVNFFFYFWFNWATSGSELNCNTYPDAYMSNWATSGSELNCNTYPDAYMSNWISSGMGMGMDGIPTTDNIYPIQTEKLGYPSDNISETTEIFGLPTDNIPDNRFFKTLNFIFFIKNKNKYV